MKSILAIIFTLTIASSYGQPPSVVHPFTHADTLRGNVSRERLWWDVLHYDLHIKFNPADSTLKGKNIISYKVLRQQQRMQIDLMEPMMIDSIFQDNTKVEFTRDGSAFFVSLPVPQKEKSTRSVTVYFHGRPHVAVRPPWNGGVVWARDKDNRPWTTVACQGLGASVWYPCKDHQYDEPDSAAMHITTPAEFVAVSNGRLIKKTTESSGEITWNWRVVTPINNYDFIPYIGYYKDFSEVYKGENGNLDVSFQVLDYNLPLAHSHLQPDVMKMLKDFEYWFGPYPFYKDGYKIVDAPHLGMEHQSAIAYGNKYLNGYLNRDLSQSGWGLKWDFIVVHESAHEWFGNNITTKDIADMWVHESFANYSETLFTESEFGREAASDYIVGCRKGILNDKPIIGTYNVNSKGSGDMYSKGGNMIHTIRQIINNDEKFRQILRGLNKTFYHQTVTSAQIESYISKTAGIDLSKVFTQYLRTIKIPLLVWNDTQHPGYLQYSWTNCIPGFDMPVKIFIDGKSLLVNPTEKIKELKITSPVAADKIVDRNFYVEERKN